MFWNILECWAACLLLCAQTLAGPLIASQVNQAPRPALPPLPPQHPDLVPTFPSLPKAVLWGPCPEPLPREALMTTC